jgi:serine phosphatase RsbU (regulator of sigma subunit)
MKKEYLRKVLLVFLLTRNVVAFSQWFFPVCKNFGIEDYTEDAEFQCAVSDNDGTMYFGSNYGVFVYRGEKRSINKSWDIMRLPAPDIIRSLYLDSVTKRLFAGGQNDFGYFQLNRNGACDFISLRNYLPFSHPEGIEIWHIYKQNSQLIFHTLYGLLIYEEGKKIQIIPSPENGIFHNVFKLRDNTLLINSINNGWFLYNGTLNAVPINPELPIDKCYSVLNLRNTNKYLLFFRNSGVYEVDITNNSFSEIKKISNDGFDNILSEGQLYGALFNNDSTKIIIATLTKGALLVNYTGFLKEENIFSETQSATNILSVYGLYTDKLRNTWVLGKSNLSLLPSDLSLIHKDFRGITVNGLALCNNKLYVSAINGLYCLDLENKLLSRAKKLLHGPFNKLILINDTIFTYTSTQLVKICKEKIYSYQSPSPIKSMANVNGKLWICNKDGIYIGLANMVKGNSISSMKNIMQALQVKNVVYVLVQDLGLFLLNTDGIVIGKVELNKDFVSTNNAKLFNSGEELLISNLSNTYKLKGNIITVTDAMKLWMQKTCVNGSEIKFEYDNSDVTSLKIKERNSSFFTNANSFMSAVDVNDVEYYNGYYYLATKNGLSISKLLVNKPAETVRILKLTTDSLEFHTTDSIRIPYERSKSINVFCSLNSFYNSFDNTQYSYRLHNYDKGWVTQSCSNFNFSHLHWGSYTLEIKVNYGNDQESKTAVLHFVIVRPWWATVWAIVLWCTLFVLFIYIIVQISIHRLKKSKIRLEHIVKERTAEVVRQKNEINIQKEKIENKNHEITDSINYARRIQSALLKGEDKLKDFLIESFVLYIPKDIVSGDFYWFTEVMNYCIIAVADCTGHGVPGAFMSMLGVAKLNDLAVKNIYMPHDLLHELNHLIVETLGQKTIDSDSRDGMDAAIICIDKTSGKLYYAGANRPLFIINRDENTALELKPTKLPVGGGQYGENRDYQLHEINIRQNISVYLSTDGYADQFGGLKGKKFRTDRLQKLLLEIAHDSPEEQKKKLEQNYLDWRGSLDQVDDVCLVGINFNA